MSIRPPEPDDDGYDDLRESVRERRRLGRNYVALLAPVALIVGVVAFGVFGKVTAPPTEPPSPSPVAVVRTPAPRIPAQLAEPTPQLDLVAVDRHRPVVAALGRELFYVSGRTILARGLWDRAQPAVVASVGPCDEIDGIAVSGTTLLYAVAHRGLVLTNSCEPTRVASWDIHALDLPSGGAWRVATGTAPANVDPTAPAVHIAISGDSVAFERPVPHAAAGRTPSWTGYAIEVHSLASGRLLWKGEVTDPVADLMLGGGTVAVLTDAPRQWVLYVGRLDRDGLDLVTSLSSGASLSSDGRYLVWDSGEPLALRDGYLMLMDVEANKTSSLGAIAGSPGLPLIDPGVSNVPGGVVAAWYAWLPSGDIGVRFVDPAHPGGAWLATGATPEWMSVQGDDLVWLEPTNSSSSSAPAVHVTDLPSTPLTYQPGP